MVFSVWFGVTVGDAVVIIVGSAVALGDAAVAAVASVAAGTPVILAVIFVVGVIK